jgi:hypothetical protein
MGGNASNIQLGIGDLEIKVYSAGAYTSGFASPGFHSDKGITATYKGDIKDYKSGNQLGTVKKFITGESLDMEGALAEATALNMARALGLADTDIADDAVNHIKSFQIGGVTAISYFTARYTAKFEGGLFARITIFKGSFARDCKLEMKPDAFEIPIKIEANVDDATGVTNGKLALVEFKYQ